MRITALGRTLSLLEGDTKAAVTRAKAWDTKGTLDLTQDPTRTFTRMRGFRNVYLQGGYIAEGADLFPIFAIGGGFELEIDEKIAEKVGSDGEAEKQLAKEFFDRINFFDVQWQLSTDAEAVRDGIAEIVYGNGQLADVPVNVVPRPAECFEFRTNLTGAIVTYDQVCDNRGNTIQPIVLEPARVLHYQFLSRSDSPYGISIVERTLHDIKRDTRTAEAIANGVHLHGTPKYCTTVNASRPDAAPLSDEEWKKVEDSQKDFNAKDNFLYEGDVKMTVIDTTGVPNIQQYSDVMLFRVCAGMGVPPELLGLRQGTTDATAVSRIGAFLKKVKIVQRDIESLWNLNVIDKVIGKPGLIKMKLNDANPEDFVQIATAIAALRQGQYPEKVAPWQWARQRLKIPTNKELEIPEVPEDPVQPDPGQSSLVDWLNRQKPGNAGMMPDDQVADAEKQMAAAAHELSDAVRGIVS